MKSIFLNGLIVFSLGLSSYALQASESSETNHDAIKQFEKTFGISGERRYISFPVKTGYQNTRTSLLSFLDDHSTDIKIIHGKPYVISSVTGVVPTEFLDDVESENIGRLVNRSTDTSLGKTIDSVYEYTYENGFIERFSVQYLAYVKKEDADLQSDKK